MSNSEFKTVELPPHTKQCAECGVKPTHYIGSFGYVFMRVHCPLCGKTTAYSNMEDSTVNDVVAAWNKLNK